MNLAQMQAVLSSSLKDSASMFARVGKRHIINLNYVYLIAILRQKLTLSDGENFEYTIPVSKDALKKLRDLLITSITAKQNING